MTHNRTFKSLALPLMRMTEENDQRYLIYAINQEPAEVEALTAREALEKSKIANPDKIIHIIRNMDKPLIDKELLNATEKLETLPELVPSIETELTDTPPA